MQFFIVSHILFREHLFFKSYYSPYLGVHYNPRLLLVMGPPYISHRSGHKYSPVSLRRCRIAFKNHTDPSSSSHRFITYCSRITSRAPTAPGPYCTTKHVHSRRRVVETQSLDISSTSSASHLVI